MVDERVEYYFVEMRGEEVRSATIPNLRVAQLSLDVLIAYELWKLAHGLE